MGQTVEAASEELLKLISIDPNGCDGRPCVKGTRVLVTVVLDALAAGLPVDQVLVHSPTLTTEGVHAAIRCGATWVSRAAVGPMTS